MGMVKVAIELLKNTDEIEIKQTDLLLKVSKITGYSTESVRGTIIGTPPHKLYGSPYFKEHWAFCRRPHARIVRKEFVKAEDVYETNYDTENKREARRRAFAPLVNKESAKILTMAGEHGRDVEDLLNINSNFEIHNVEYIEDILNKFKEKGLPVKQNYFGNIENYIKESKETFTYIYYDAISYACRKIHK
jgi:hypothetical protein